MSTLISRNPFAREELHREKVVTSHTCDWCGGTRKDGSLFRYFILPDRVRYERNDIKGMFCSIGCMRDYHE